ncbi:MAG: DUF4936 family protein [Casimicrobiaceae bacterium]
MSGATHFYVWYTVTVERAAARRAAADLLAAVEERTGIAGRILARRDDASTWMEIYENVGDAAAFERALDVLVRRGDAARISGGVRHVERFAALADVMHDEGGT